MEDIKAIARRYVERVWNEGDLGATEEFIPPEYVAPGNCRHLTGPEGARAFIRQFRDAFPDLQMTIEDLLSEGDKVMVRWTARATHRGSLMGIPPTGKRVNIAGIYVDRIVGGKIRESWGHWDMLTLFEQIGAAPRIPG